jgi:hypothetical protein
MKNGGQKFGHNANALLETEEPGYLQPEIVKLTICHDGRTLKNAIDAMNPNYDPRREKRSCAVMLSSPFGSGLVGVATLPRRT